MEERELVQNLRHKIELYFDKALPENEQQDLLLKVKTDPDCSEMFNNEKSFRDLIKNGVKRTPVSPDLIQTIKERIRL